MNKTKENNGQPKIIKADHKLQVKVGTGPLDEQLVIASQKVIENNDVDFAPVGLAILKKLEAALESVEKNSVSAQQAKSMLTAPVMELKANAAIFHYHLIGSLANIMLSFLEAITTMDDDAVKIVRAHHDSLHMILVRRMAGDGGAAGKQLTAELQDACRRYHQRRTA
jgi:hypothetical protein